MANYIDKLILSESYIYIKDYDLTDEAKARIERFLEASIELRSESFFLADVKYDLKVEKGSLKIKCTILGSLAVFMASAANFREAVDRAHESSKFFASAIVVDGVVAAKRPMYKIDAKEARLGVPGRLKRLLLKLSALSTFSANWKPIQAANEIESLKKDIKNLYNDIGDDSERALISKGLLGIIAQDFPKTLPASASQQQIAAHQIQNNYVFAETVQIITDGKTPERKSLEVDWKVISHGLAFITALLAYLTAKVKSQPGATSVSHEISPKAAERLAATISVKEIKLLKKLVEDEKLKLQELVKDDSRTHLFREEAANQVRSKICKRLRSIEQEVGGLPITELKEFYSEFKCKDSVG